jgi:ATP-GRASP peptide maturase of grasp-with-spasm system
MILILSRSVSEISTNKVIDYLLTMKASFFRLNGDDLFNQKVKINFHYCQNKFKWEFVIISDNLKFSSSEINVVWYRRDFFDELDNLSEKKVINNFLKAETKRAYDLLHLSLKDLVWINKPNEIINKLAIIEEASKSGLNIPESFVSNNLEYVGFMNKKFSLITKPISEGISFIENGKITTTFTNIVDYEKLSIGEAGSNDFIFPSLFQSMIEKEYEVRTFYFFGVCYSIAIFSQYDDKTKIDFRNYNTLKPNRMSKYTLPSEIEAKIERLMRKLNMNSGSIDFIRSKTGEYFFLEINPIGQFDFLEILGNYNISETISNKLFLLDGK